MADRAQHVAMTADLVSAYVSNNTVGLQDLPSLIATVSTALTGLDGPPPPAAQEPLKPAVAIKRSVTPDLIYCLEDGKGFKSLRRHLRTKYGLTPEDYRAKWGLPADYPMVAPIYAATRSALAKAAGLGARPRASEPAPSAAKPARKKLGLKFPAAD